MSNERRACKWGRCNGTVPADGGKCDRCGTVTTFSRTEPEPGTWADVARMMASLGGDDGIDWDAWKDEMKETDGKGY